MKQYLVTIKPVQIDFGFDSTKEREVSREELPPNARVLTEKELREAINRCNHRASSRGREMSPWELVDELFGVEE